MSIKKRARAGSKSDDIGNKTPKKNGIEHEATKSSETVIEMTPSGPIAESKKWKESIARVVKSVVSIRFSQVAAFDTDESGTGEASAFVVDAKNGYMLTNRHVVCAGPFVGHAVFDNHEEVEVFPVYRDPVHDFGFLRFDPKKIRYMNVEQLELRPDLAKVGTEIRVVGNDAAEKLSILAGWISRIDRNVPDYGELTYCDFNTNYIQAAANASGGSSGSPVVERNGNVVALQAGGHMIAATDYFLPLDRPLRALRCLQNNTPITRGTIQAQFLIKTFDECSRLGLDSAMEEKVRTLFPEATSMLVVETVLPEGPSFKKLKEGDILLYVNSMILINLIELESILDESVGKDVVLTVQRGSELVELTCTAQSTHDIAPDRYVEVCGAKFHNLSYQLARQYALPVKGVFISEPAGSFRLEGPEYGYILDSIAYKPVPDLDTFIEVMRDIPDRSRVAVGYHFIHDKHSLITDVVEIDRHWLKAFRMVTRNDETGLWDFKNLGDPLPAEPSKPCTTSIPKLNVENFGPTANIINCFVKVLYYMPLHLDGSRKSRKKGTALVLDKDKGLAVTSRSTVPYDLGDLTITVADSIQIPAEVVHLHPTQNLAFIKYDPKLLGDTPIQAAKLKDYYVSQGDPVNFFGFNSKSRVVAAKTSVTDVITMVIPSSPMPRFRAINFESITVESNLSTQCGSGVLTDDDGLVVALWLTHYGEQTSRGTDVKYHLGLASPVVLSTLRRLQSGVNVNPRILNVEFRAIQLAQARSLGLPAERIRKIETESGKKHQLFMITHVEAGTPRILTDGDIIISANGKSITRIRDLQVDDVTEVDMEILREGKVQTVKVPTFPSDNCETNRVVICWGATLQAPHRAVRLQIEDLPSNVFVTNRGRGSPADQYDLGAAQFITAVNGVTTLNLEDFVREIRKIDDNSYVRVSTSTFDKVPVVLTIKMNKHYFPTIDLVQDAKAENGWRAVQYDEVGEKKNPSMGFTIDEEVDDNTFDTEGEQQ
ncbi:serine protease, involved in lipid metabolism [Schizosaccharomyces pombe]|uniref:PDZ domain-containing protein C23G3.12c n=1 Tax=Schizosaccharomyces pombe (strain 972 / ATCC 24843) TaxID=284812 RepID=YIFC_SCHPO|nr:putative serine protease [Schizosaccharomyces pombe]Q9P7S1.1 RecName: Full=PDZ domain-containing protein C23G3.12c [Schizosaccharomyces pombe 972h-]CAB72237.1 serine protease (predicted) [Schizosaccharomyces pombe]|eukprot:NP_593112.1 putative serine protease [Schizosaccharomyces pombe]